VTLNNSVDIASDEPGIRQIDEQDNVTKQGEDHAFPA
jgi:hypothetical protein